MKKTLILVLAIAILTIGAVSAVYANDTRQYGRFGGPMMNQGNSEVFNEMTDVMRNSGFQSAAEAMENRDFNAMNDFMNNITDYQYEQMIEIMRDSGYQGMASMMESVDREVMVDMHNSMMGI